MIYNSPSLSIHCKASPSDTVPEDQTQQVSRRTLGDFIPDTWQYDYIQSIDNKYRERTYKEENRVLRADVRLLLSETVNPLHQLELIDTLERLGLAYHFKSEIHKILENIYDMEKLKNKNLHATALEFRLLRQHGYDISTDVFDGFKNEEGDFQTSLCGDIKGMLSLYEASFLLMKDEIILEKAMDFTSNFLKEFMSSNSEEHELTSQVKHALEVPLHWNLPRWEARWFISEYERMPNMNSTLLYLAKLDYNMVQAMYQEEVKSNIGWWERTGLGKKISFFRCRVVVNYLWGFGMMAEPHAEKLRRVVGNLCDVITIIDDLYDVHGTLQELELYTAAILRWDPNDLDGFPDFMKVSFSAIYNFVDEIASDIQREKGLNVHSYLKKGWQDICKAYLTEARWYHGGKTPGLKEYLENGWVSIGAPLLHLHAYLLMPNNRISDLDLPIISLHQQSNLIYLSGLNFRLLDDLGSFKREQEMGDVPSSIECYMNGTGVSEEEAIKYMKSLTCKTWQKMNQEVANSSFSRDFNITIWGLSRIGTFFYNNGDDAFTIQDSDFKDRVHSLLFQPFPITSTT